MSNLTSPRQSRRRSLVALCASAFGALSITTGASGATALVEGHDVRYTAPGVLGVSHAKGTIHYPEGGTGHLIVIKLGLVADDPADLLNYRLADRGFAHHSTFLPPWRVMWYGQERFDKYRAVGYANVLAASATESNPQPAAD